MVQIEGRRTRESARGGEGGGGGGGEKYDQIFPLKGGMESKE
jgi:hypothetical protein